MKMLVRISTYREAIEMRRTWGVMGTVFDVAMMCLMWVIFFIGIGVIVKLAFTLFMKGWNLI
jgi:hypothetical protein